MAKKYDDLLKKVDQNIQNQKEYLQVKPFLDSPYASVFEKLGIIQRVDDTPKTVAHTQGEYANPGNNIQQNFTPRGIEYGLSDNPRLGHNFEASQTGNQTLDAFLNQLQVAEQQRQAQAAQEQARQLAEQQRQANQQNRVNSRLNQIDARDNALNTLPVVSAPQNSPIPENVMDLIAPQTANEKNPYLPTVQARQPYNSWLQGMRAYQDENGNIIRDEEGNTYHIPINRASDGYNAHTVSDTGINALDKAIDSINYINARGANAFDTFNNALNSLGTGILDSIKGAKDALGTGKEAGGLKLPNLNGFDTAGRKPVFQSSTGENGAVKSQEEFNETKGASNVLGKAQENYIDALEKGAKESNSAAKREVINNKYKTSNNPVVRTLGDLNEAIAGQLPYVAMNAIPGVGQVLAPAMRGLTSSVNAYEEARAEGASKTQAQRYAGREAVNQSLGEILIEGIAGLDGGILGKTLARSKAGRALAKAYGTHITSPLAKTAIKYTGKMLGEGVEEMLQDVVSNINKKTTYDPNAKLSAKEVAYSGLLGGLMAGVFNAPNIPSDYRAYRSDYDTVNSMSQAAAAVKSREEARLLNLQMDILIDECNANLGEYAMSRNEEDFDMRARYEYIKNGIQTIKDTMNADLDAIIDSNTKFNDAVTNIANAPADNIVNETAALVAAVSDTVEPEEDVVKATIDRVNEEIQDINATEQDIRGMSDAEFADWWYNARFKNAFPGLVDAMNHVPNNLLTSGDALAQQIAERNARYQQNPENNARFDNEAGLHIDAYKQGVITQLEMQKNILANIDSILRNQKNEVKEAVTDLLTPNANGDTIETKNPVVQADGESLAPVPNETTAPGEPKYIMKRGTYTAPGTNETYDLIQKPRNLSKQEYAELKKAVMDNGGLGWNKNANGFLIRPGRLDDVRKALEKIGVGIEGETPAQTATESKPTGNVRTPNETVPQFEVAGSTTETLTGERGDIPQFEVVGDTNIVPATETGIQNQNGGAVDETVRNGNTETTTETTPTVNNSDLNGTGVKKTPSAKTETSPQREPEEEAEAKSETNTEETETEEKPKREPIAPTPKKGSITSNIDPNKWSPDKEEKLTEENFPYTPGVVIESLPKAYKESQKYVLLDHDKNGVLIIKKGDNVPETKFYSEFEHLIRSGVYTFTNDLDNDELTNYQNRLVHITPPIDPNRITPKQPILNALNRILKASSKSEVLPDGYVVLDGWNALYDAYRAIFTEYDLSSLKENTRIQISLANVVKRYEQNAEANKNNVKPITILKDVASKYLKEMKAHSGIDGFVLADNAPGNTAITVNAQYLKDVLDAFPDAHFYVGSGEKAGSSPVYFEAKYGRGFILPMRYQADSVLTKTAKEISQSVGYYIRDYDTLLKEPEESEKETAPLKEPEETPIETPSEKPAEPADANAKAAKEIADWVKKRLDGDFPPFSKQDLQVVANNAYGGTQAQGAYTVKDMTDALELGINEHLISDISENKDEYTGNANEAKATLKDIEQFILAKIPTQTNRTEGQIQNQQFSTPPNIAFVANWVANIDDKDTVLEPSAGVGGLASFGKGIGAKVYVNEWDPRRLSLIKQLPFDGFYKENAEHIDRILPESIKPSVVVMNPPFSANGRTKNNTKNAIPHIEQALARLQPGGRLVAILGGGRDEGGGMSDTAPSFKAWWNKLRDSGYDIRANIGIDGSNYSKYGTSFNVRLVVIDKTGNQEEPTLTGEYEDLSEAIEDLEDIRNDRQRNIGKASEEVQSNGTVKSGGGTSESGAKPGGRPSGTGKRSPDSGKSTNAGHSDGDGQSNDDLSSNVSNRPSGELDVESEKPSDEVRVSDGELESGQGRKPSVNGGSSESGEGNEQSGGMGSREPSGGTSEQSGELVSTGTGIPGTVDEVSEYSLGDVLDLDGTRYIVTGFDANGEPQLMLHPYQIGNTVEIDGKKYTIVDFEEDGRPIAEEYREPVKGNASQKYSVKAPERITLPAINLVEALNNGQIKVVSTPNSNGSASTVKSGPKTISLSDLKKKAGQGASIKKVGNSASLGPVKIRTSAEKPTTIDDVSVMTPATDTTAPGASGEIVVDERVEPPKKQEKKKAAENDDGVYADYRTSDIPFEGAQKHPAILVESSAMSAVQSPPINYKPKLDQKLIEKGVWSDIQIELICYAGQAHREILPSGERKGYCCGDGTGVGKGREIAGIIMDNFNQGRRRAIWITEKAGLIEDAKRDWVDAGGKISDIFTFADSKKKKGFPKEGILFITYDTLKGKPIKGGDPNVDVVEKWFGKDFDGAICFDEAHNMANLDPVKGARGRNKAAEKAIAGNKLQNDLKNARVTYFSATAATEVSNLAYASRLGLWGLGTSFENERDFVSKIGSAGISAMELVARDMKAMGLYLARSITFEGVTYETLNHDLTPVQVAMYNRMSEGWQVVLQNFEKAMEVTGSMNVKAVKQRRAQAYSNMQLFYNQIITSMTMPTVLKDIEKSLDEGQSCVIQLVNTQEAAQDREVQKIKENGGDLDEMDITPRQLLVGYVEKAFPIYQYEAYLDEDGNTQYQIVTDSEGNPVINKEALQMKEDLIADLNEISIPEGPLDQLINYFGEDKVAEVTGRSQRVVYKVDEKTGKPKKVLEKRNSVSASIAEAKAFQDGDKRILVFSNAGSTGRSFHSDRRAKNQQKRRHYLLQLGWTASTATQGFGRTNRSNQSEPPSYVLVTTNVKGHKRFVTSIARRLDQLGALTKGQRQTGSGIIGEKDNLESPLSVKALQSFYKKLGSGYYSYYDDDDGGLDAQDILHRMGLDKYFYDKYGNFNPNTPVAGEITTFLNRLLALPVEDQNKVFDAFEYERDKFYNEAIENGTLDRGLENVKADKIEIVEESVVYTDPKTGAETKYVKAKLYDKPDVVTTIAEAESKYPGFSGVYRLPDGTVKAAYRRKDTTDSKTGEVIKQFMLIGPNQGKVSNYIESTLNKTCVAIPKKEWQSAWDEELKTVPAYNESEAHMITGALLPIWRKLPSSGTIKAKRITASNGEQYLGRIIAPNIIESVLRQLDVTVKKEKYTGAQIRDMIMKQGKMITFNSDGGGVDIVSRRRVSGEYRIEVSPANAFGFKMIYPDVITESIQSRKRYFIPDSKKGEAILQKMIENGVRSIGDSEDSGQLYSAGPARGRWKVQKDSGVQYSKDESKGKWKLRKRQEGEVLSISELVDEAQRIFGIPINVGRMGPVPRSVQGLFKEFPETIRTKQYGDLPTIAHEIGHWYDKKYRLRESPYIKSVISEFQEDLEKAGYKPSQYPFESVAEYFREYLSDREATEQKFRQFTNWMYKTINPTDQRRLAEYSGMTNAYFAADLDRRASAQVHYRTDDNSVQKKAQVVAEELQRNPNEYLGGLSRDFVRAWFDDLVDLRGFGKTYDLAYYEKQARSIAYGRLTSAMTDKHGNIVGKSLADILADAKIDAKNARTFDEYLIARVALDHFEAKERGENVGTLVYGDEELNNADSIAERIDTYERENPTFHDASEELYEYQNHLLDLAVNSGLMDEELKDRLNELYPHYVPLYRVMDDAKQRTRGAKRGYADQNTPIARFKGSGRDIYSPIESIIQNTEKFTASCMRNDVMVEFANYIDRNEGMGWAAEKIPQAKILDYISTDELGKRLDAFRRNTDRLDKMTEEEKIDLVDSIMAFVGDTLSQWKPAAKQGKNVVSVMRGGKRSYYEVHDEGLYKALTNMDAPQYGFITRIFGAITRANKFFYTSSNPQFIFTNPQRDIVTGFISSTTTDNPARYLWDFGKAYKDAIMNSAEYKEYMREGGGYMGSVTSDYNILKRVKKDVVKPDQGVIKNFLDHVAELVPRLVDAGESASRLAEWKRAIAQGDDAMTAMRKAQEVTVNFARGGRIVKEINQYVPFFMAGFNALAHNYDLFVNGGDGGGGRNGNNGFGLDLSPEGRNRRAKAWMKWLLTTGLLAFLTWLFNYIISPKITGESEEEVKKNCDDLSNYNKNAFYNLYIGDHKFFRVKKTQDMAIPSTIVERMVEYYVLDQKDSMNGLADFCMDQILPVNPFGGEDFVDCAEKAFSEVTLLGTVVDLARNKDFKGSPIVSKSYEYKEAEDQIKPTTSNIWVSVGKAIHASPIQLQYIAEDNFGWAARLVDSLTQVNGERSLGISNKLISDSVYSTDIINDLYDTRDEFEARKKKYAEHLDSDKYSNEDVLGYYKFSKATDLYSDLNARIRAEGNNDIARDMKIQANAFVDTINKTGMTDLDKSVADIAESAGVDIKDIAPYIVTVDHIKTNGVEFPMTFDDMILYYTQAQTAFENAYGQILQSGYDDATSAAMMVQARKYIDSELKKAWKEKLVARAMAENNQ